MNPFETTTELMAHQREAVAKVLPSRVGALFMEMGTGKSRTAIELARLRAGKIMKVVWCCPVSLKETVRSEVLKHTDSKDIYLFDEKTTSSTLPDVRWYIVGIESLSSSNRITFALSSLVDEETMVVVDESSYIKGHRSKRTERITAISRKARYRLILTGTPLSQGVVDLFAQMRFLSPKILGYSSFYSFAANHLEYSEKFPGKIVRAHNVKYLAAKVAPYVYQVRKDECLSLPEKLYESRYTPLTGQQRDAYEQAKEEIFADIEECDEYLNSIIIFRLFTALQSITCGFWHRLLTPMREIVRGRGKKTEFREFSERRTEMILDTVRGIPGEKIIIWSKFRYCVEKIVRALSEEYGSESVAQFHGGLSETARAAEVDRFRQETRFFVATQSCGGHGLTLNEAHYVLFHSDGFKYSERLQAEDRTHRIGQGEKVTYISLYAPNTIDERIDAALAAKGNALAGFRAEVAKIKGKGMKEAARKLVMGL